jgi:hypothetical protein
MPEFNAQENRMLLWHGSRLTNWVGILSQGLRIAPPEAPVTGYMFGKVRSDAPGRLLDGLRAAGRLLCRHGVQERELLLQQP